MCRRLVCGQFQHALVDQRNGRRGRLCLRQTGLFDAGAKRPGTSHDLAERAGLNERYVRDRLGAMTTGGIFAYHPVSRMYSLPSKHAVLLRGDTELHDAGFTHVEVVDSPRPQNLHLPEGIQLSTGGNWRASRWPHRNPATIY